MAHLDDLREEMEKLRGRKLQLVEMTQSPGWALFETALIADIRSRGLREMKTPLGSLDGAFLSATVRGEMAGMYQAQTMPLSLLDDIELELNNLITEFEEIEQDD